MPGSSSLTSLIYWMANSSRAALAWTGRPRHADSKPACLHQAARRAQPPDIRWLIPRAGPPLPLGASFFLISMCQRASAMSMIFSFRRLRRRSTLRLSSSSDIRDFRDSSSSCSFDFFASIILRGLPFPFSASKIAIQWYICLTLTGTSCNFAIFRGLKPVFLVNLYHPLIVLLFFCSVCGVIMIDSFCESTFFRQIHL